MVLHATQPTVPVSAAAVPLDDKENVGVVKPSQPQPAPAAAAAKQHANGRRPRSRPAAHSGTPSPVLLAREAARDPRAARRRAQSQSPQPAAVLTVSVPSRGALLLPDHTATIGDADIEMSDSTTTPAVAGPMEGSPAAAAPPQRRVQLPRFLRRPAFRAIAPEAIAAVEPDLKDVALEYILEGLRAAGPQLFHAATNARANPPRNRLPRELQVVVSDSVAENALPTHLVAVYSKPAARVTIHPVHSLVLAAHCAHLPPLPPTTTATDADTATATTTTTTLPVVPICLPSPATFPILLQYLYTKRVDHLLASLLPAPPARDDDPAAASAQTSLSQTLAATFTHPVLLAHAAKVHGVWSDAAALGVFEDRLWRTIETAWKVLLDALAASPGSGDATWKKEKEEATVARDDVKMQMVR